MSMNLPATRGATKLDEAFLVRMPVKECGGLFCLNTGPSTSLQIVCEGPVPNLIVGFCAVCKRYVCGQCAVLQAGVKGEGEEGSILACRYCGLALGSEPGRLLVSRKPAEILMEADAQSANADQSELQDSDWVELYRDAVRRGVIKTSGMRAVEAIQTQGRDKRMLALLEREESLCRRAGYDAGLAHCESKKTVALMSLNRHKQALASAETAAGLWRRLGNPKMLARLLFGKYFLLFGKHFLNRPDQRTPDAKLAELQEMWDAARGIEPRIVELAITERTHIHLERGDIASFIGDLKEASDGTRKVEDMVTLWQANKGSVPATPRLRSTTIDEQGIRRMRTSVDVWGCRNGCIIEGTLGVVGIPKGKTIDFPCPFCGVRYVCLNNYSRLTASVPDWPGPATLNRREFRESARLGIAIANLGMLMLDDQRVETSHKLQEMAVNVWAQHLETHTVDFACCLDGLAGALLSRDEHEESRNLCQRGVLIAEALDPAVPRLLASLLTNLGVSLACLGEYVQGEHALRRSLDLDSEMAAPYYWLAKLYYFRAGREDRDSEVAAWRSYLAKNTGTGPRRSEAKARLAALGLRDLPSDESLEPNESLAEALEKLKHTADDRRLARDDQGLLDCLAEQFDGVRRTDSGGAEDIIDEMERVGRRLNTPSALLSALSRRAEMLVESGDVAQYAVLVECEELARRLNDGSALATSLYAQGILLENQGQLDQALEKWDEAAMLYSQLQNARRALACLKHSSRTLSERREWSLAAPCAQAMTRAARFLEGSGELVRALQQEAQIMHEVGENGAELEILGEIAAICRRDGDELLLIECLCRQSDLLMGMGVDSSPSHDLLTEAYELSKLQVARFVAQGTSEDAAEYQAELNRRRMVISGFDRISRALKKSGQSTIAIAMYEHAIQLRSGALDSAPNDHGLRLDMIAGLDELGGAFLEENPDNAERAIECFKRGMAELQKLDQANSSRADDAERRSIRDAVVGHLEDARRRRGWRAAATAIKLVFGRGQKSREH